jgi:hypothetical protein
VSQATTVYRTALRKAELGDDDEGKAVVAYYFSGHLSRKANEPEQALEYAKMAHEHFRIPETGQELGKVLMWNSRFEDAQLYLEECLETAQGKTRIIAITSMVESWRRWSEQLLNEQRRPAEAVDKAYAGFSIGTDEINSGTYDERLTECVLETASMFLRSAGSRGADSEHLERQLVSVLKFIDFKKSIFSTCRGYRSFIRNLASLGRVRQLPPHARLLEDPELARRSKVSVVESRNSESEVLVGSIRLWRGTFGFIGHNQYPDDVFCPASSICNMRGHGTEFDLTGEVIKFRVEPGEGPRQRAGWAEIQWQA